jgi:UDP-N-acetyl-D-galactosamine dehydrogenase
MTLAAGSKNAIDRVPGIVQPVGVVGLGYVGLQLAVAFGRRIPALGFDIDARRVKALRDGSDWTGEVDAAALQAAKYLSLTSDPADLDKAAVYIIAVPTPVDAARRPDLSPLMSACEIVGRSLRSSVETGLRPIVPIVVFESTVYPGCTEEVCVPLLERTSGLTCGRDFKIGYSPERINPGDAEHSLERVVKVVAGQDPDSTDTLAALYGLIVDAGVYRAPDIRTAEAAKVIENVQRDLNIALMNELALLFHRLGLETHEVLKAARTKWNFLPFEPGLVGGHCIPVDPYYLTHKAQEVGFLPEVILAGRRTNDSLGFYVARETIRLLIGAGRVVRGATVLVLGATFKEDVKDVRNTRVTDIVSELRSYGVDVGVHDPLADARELEHLGFVLVADPFESGRRYDGVILAVPHHTFRQRAAVDFLRLVREQGGVLVDVKGLINPAESALPLDGTGPVSYWRL